jgi:hypothetical protein
VGGAADGVDCGDCAGREEATTKKGRSNRDLRRKDIRVELSSGSNAGTR